MSTVHDRPGIPAIPVVVFDWTPKDVAFTHTHSGNIYPWTAGQPVAGAPDQPDTNYTATNTDLTFTASVSGMDAGTRIIDYFWRFGDGSVGYGSPVHHTYRGYSSSTRVHLTVTDNHGRQFHCGRQMNLVPAEPINMGQGIIAP